MRAILRSLSRASRLQAMLDGSHSRDLFGTGDAHTPGRSSAAGARRGRAAAPTTGGDLREIQMNLMYNRSLSFLGILGLLPGIDTLRFKGSVFLPRSRTWLMHRCGSSEERST
jgi:hypothetical protein